MPIIHLYGQFLGGNGDGSVHLSTSNQLLNDQSFYCYGGGGDGFDIESIGPLVQFDQTFYCSGGVGDGYQMLTSGIIIQNEQTFYCNGGVGDGFSKHSFSNLLNEQMFYCNGGNADGSSLFSSGINTANDASIYCSGGQGSGYDFEIFNSTINIQSFYCFGGLQDGYGLEELQTTINDQNLYCLGGQEDGYSFDLYSGSVFGITTFCNGGNGDGYDNEVYFGNIFGTVLFCLGGDGDGYNLGISTPSIMGIGIWTGATDSDWNTASNWNHSTVPNFTIDANIPASCPNYPILTDKLGIYSKKTTLRCKSLNIHSGATLTHTSTLYIYGEMNVAGTYIADVNAEVQQRVYSGGLLTVSSTGTFLAGNQSSGTGVNDLWVYAGGTLNLNGGTLEIDDQFLVRTGGTFQMTGGELFTHKYGEGTTYSSSFPGNLVIQSGALGSVTGGTIKICGRESFGDYDALTILEPSFEFSGTSTIQFEHGIFASHYNPGINLANGVTLQNLSINKAGNTVFVRSDLVVKGELIIEPGSTLEIETGNQATVGP